MSYLKSNLDILGLSPKTEVLELNTRLYSSPVTRWSAPTKLVDQYLVSQSTEVCDKHDVAEKESANEAIMQPALEKVMQQIRAITGFNRIRKEEGLHSGQTEFIGHFLFTGPPGTGKTSAANVMTKLLFEGGLIQKNHVVIATRKDLVGEYIGKTALKTQSVIEAAKGGVLFIDEVYTLVRSEADGKDFGREALETLMVAMSDTTGNKDDSGFDLKPVMIFAGYEKEMVRVFDANPGLKDRLRWKVVFEAIDIHHLTAFGVNQMINSGYSLESGAEAALMALIQYKQKEEDFAYLRTIKNVIAQILLNKPMLFAETGDKSLLSHITVKEIQALYPCAVEVTVQKLLDTLEGMVGLSSVKAEIKKYLNRVDYNVLRLAHQMPQAAWNGHMLFLGNPGTGKTTVARLTGQLLAAKGYLPSGHLVEVGRHDLVSNVVGGTALKTLSKIKEAHGGILFIDEAYALVYDDKDQFGKEALDTLVKEMEERRESFIVIMAGYANEMETLLRYNPGLRSRMATTLLFEDYSFEDFCDIIEHLLETGGYTIEPSCRSALRKMIQQYYEKRGCRENGRGARSFVESLLQAKADSILAQKKRGEIITSDLLSQIDSETCSRLKPF